MFMWAKSVIRHPENGEDAGGTGAGPALFRRRFLLGGFLTVLAAAYGLFASFATRFIFPKRRAPRRKRIFIAFASEIGTGKSKAVVLPSGDQMLISNTGRLNPESGNTFAAFSSSCPHLGCKVHWEARRHEFLCPCHGGVFTAAGVAIAGPPGQSHSNLKSYRIEVDGESVFAVVEEV